MHEIDEAEGRTFISMAFVDGETLEDRIARGPLPIRDALEIGQQIAKGLAAAHEKGIVHRDIKPANVLVAQDGQVTIMDFGLARLTEASRLTKADTTMGTVAYMSPEQAQGGEIDHRTDLWSLGCVVYEMIAGLRPFKGDYDQALLYEIVQQDPEPLTGVRAGVPMELELIVGKCLAKEASDRYQSAKEIAVDLRTLAEKMKSGRSTILRTGLPTVAPASPAAPAADHPLSKYRVIENVEEGAGGSVYKAEDTKLRRLVDVRVLTETGARQLANRQRLQGFALAGVSLLALVLGGALFFGGGGAAEDGERHVRRFSFEHRGLDDARISPDGRYIVYTAQTDGEFSLWLRPLASESSRHLPGTTGAFRFLGGWSPDSRSILFAQDGELKRIGIDGGDPVTLCDLPGAGTNVPLAEATWSPDGERIVFSSGSAGNIRLYEIPTRGGEPRPLFEPDQPGAFYAPHFLPPNGGSHKLLYTHSLGGDPRIEVLELETGERREVGPGMLAVYSPQGYLLHGLSNNQPGLSATPFSLDQLEAIGDTFPVADAGFFVDLSRDGTMVYTDASSSGARRIVVRDRAGEVVQSATDPSPDAVLPAVSPDGRFIAVVIDEDIWVHDLERDIRSRLTFGEGSERYPVWSSAGEVTYASDNRLMARTADGSGEERLLFSHEPSLFNADWTSDGRYVAYMAGDPAGGEGGIWYRERGADGPLSEAQSFLRTPRAEQVPRLSPDGRYLAYHSDESGRFEIYVRPFPEGPGKWQVSTGGGVQARWAGDGTELFYIQGTRLMAVPVSTERGFAPGRPRRLFDSEDLRNSPFDVFPDGQRFVTITTGEEVLPSVRIVENWFEEFRERGASQ